MDMQDNYVIISHDGMPFDEEFGYGFIVEKRVGTHRNWEDESEWEFLGLTTNHEYKRYHLSVEQAAKFYGKE